VQVAPAPNTAKPVSVPRAAVPPAQRVTVKGPQIYNYKPDALIKVDFSALDMQVTAAVDPARVDPLTSGMSPIGPVKKTDESQGELAFDAATDYLKTVDVKAEKQIAEAIVSFYSEKRTFLWSADNKALDKARNVAAFFAQADDDGLNPEEYAVAIPGRSTACRTSAKTC
jgi:murein L,D-transpeptidase YcbB/YkuD